MGELQLKIPRIQREIIEELMKGNSCYITLNSLEEAIEYMQSVTLTREIRKYLDDEGILYDNQKRESIGNNQLNLIMRNTILISDYIDSENKWSLSDMLAPHMKRYFEQGFVWGTASEQLLKMSVYDCITRKMIKQEKSCQQLVWLSSKVRVEDLLLARVEEASIGYGYFADRIRSATERYQLARLGGIQMKEKTYIKMDCCFGLGSLLEKMIMEGKYESLHFLRERFLGGR